MGSKALRWGEVYLGSIDLRVEVRPYMEELQKATQETIHLDIPDGSSRVCIERIESQQELRWVKQIGERMPFYASASGRALLAFLPPEEQNTILNNMVFEQLTPYTTTDPKIFRQELEITRQQGYSVSQGERAEGVSCIAAPIFNAAGKTLGAITVSGPTARFSKQKILEYAELLTQVTERISQAMGKIPEKVGEQLYSPYEISSQQQV